MLLVILNFQYFNLFVISLKTFTTFFKKKLQIFITLKLTISLKFYIIQQIQNYTRTDLAPETTTQQKRGHISKMRHA